MDELIRTVVGFFGFIMISFLSLILIYSFQRKRVRKKIERMSYYQIVIYNVGVNQSQTIPFRYEPFGNITYIDPLTKEFKLSKSEEE